MIVPGMAVSDGLAGLLAEYGDRDMGWFFFALDFIAEKESLEQGKTLGDVVAELAYVLGHFMYTPPQEETTLPTAEEILGRLASIVRGFASQVRKIGGGSANFQEELSKFTDDQQRAVFASVLDIISEGMNEAAGYVEALADHIENGEYDEVTNFFTGYAGYLFGQALEETFAIENMVRENIERNAGPVERLTGAFKNGRGKEVLNAILVKFAREAERLGVDPSEFGRANFLEQIDREVNPDAYDSKELSGLGNKVGKGSGKGRQ